MIRRFFIRLFFLGVLIWSIFWLLDRAMTKKALEDNCRRSNWIFSFKKQHFDFVFCGDSRAFHVIDIPIIEKSTGQNGLNIGFAGSGYEEQYLVIRKFIEHGNSIDQLFLQTDIASFNSETHFRNPFHHYDYLAYLKTDTLVAEVVRDNSNPVKYFLWQHIPFLKYLEFNLQFPVSILAKDFTGCKASFDQDGSWIMKGHGHEFESDSKIPYENVPLEETPTMAETSEKTLAYFFKIIAFCKKENIDLTLYTAPFYGRLTGTDENRKAYTELIQNVAEKKNVPYKTFINDSMCFNSSYFFDAAHTNELGSAIFSNEVSKYIQ